MQMTTAQRDLPPGRMPGDKRQFWPSQVDKIRIVLFYITVLLGVLAIPLFISPMFMRR